MIFKVKHAESSANFEKSSHMPKIWQKNEENALFKMHLTNFLDDSGYPENPILGT